MMEIKNKGYYVPVKEDGEGYLQLGHEAKQHVAKILRESTRPWDKSYVVGGYEDASISPQMLFESHVDHPRYAYVTGGTSARYVGTSNNHNARSHVSTYDGRDFGLGPGWTIEVVKRDESDRTKNYDAKNVLYHFYPPPHYLFGSAFPGTFVDAIKNTLPSRWSLRYTKSPLVALSLAERVASALQDARGKTDDQSAIDKLVADAALAAIIESRKDGVESTFVKRILESGFFVGTPPLIPEPAPEPVETPRRRRGASPPPKARPPKRTKTEPPPPPDYTDTRKSSKSLMRERDRKRKRKMHEKSG